MTSDPPEGPETEENDDSWEPPDPALGGPGQLFAAVTAALVIAVGLIAAVAFLSWVFR